MRIGVITGSGTYSLPGFEHAETRTYSTRFGAVDLTHGGFAGGDVVHASRHGAGHRRLSSHVNHRANVLALKAAGVEAILAVTVCGALDAVIELGSLIVFDDLYFLFNRLPDGSLCSLHGEGERGRGHWIFETPFSAPLREVLLAGARATGLPVRDSGCYGHVDGPRFNTRSEIRALAAAGVGAISQTAGPEAVLAGEAELPYALLGYVTDYANGVSREPTPVAELTRLIDISTDAFARTLAAAVPSLGGEPVTPTGSHFRFD